MIRVSRRSIPRFRFFPFALILFVIASTIDVLLVRSNLHVGTTETTNIPVPPTSTAKAPKVYIASLHWNNEQILRSHWNAAVVKLVEAFGPENIYISIHESGSWDDSKGALRELDYQLGALNARSKIILDPTTHRDEIDKTLAPSGWVATAKGKD